MKLIGKVTEIYCIADDSCKEYELELNKKALSLSNPSPNAPKIAYLSKTRGDLKPN